MLNPIFLLLLSNSVGLISPMLPCALEPACFMPCQVRSTAGDDSRASSGAATCMGFGVPNVLCLFCGADSEADDPIDPTKKYTWTHRDPTGKATSHKCGFCNGMHAKMWRQGRHRNKCKDKKALVQAMRAQYECRARNTCARARAYIHALRIVCIDNVLLLEF